MLSGVLQHALGLLAREDDVSIGDLAGVIEQDVAIAGNMLSIANSALYSRNSTISSVRQAIARIGVHKAKNALLGLSVARSFHAARVPGNWSLRFNTHSLASATLSDLIVQRVSTDAPEWAFMAGLLHDVGLLLIAAGLPDQFKMLTANPGNDVQLVERERELLGFTHFDLGAEMMSRWNCPPRVQEAVRFCERSTFQYERPLSLGAVVKTASMLADSSGITILSSGQDQGLTSELLEALDIPDQARFIAAFEMEYNGLQSCAA
jgi:HD-like signal output (HDOD) protein